MKGFFVTGTDTGVGKTVVTAALVAVARARGLNVVPMKPVQTGCVRKGRSCVASDLEFSLSMSGFHPAPGDLRRMAPYRYWQECSPHLAAKLERKPIRIDRIHSIAQRLESDYDALVVEGAGGILVPINRDRTQLDIMTRLGLPVILVSRPKLGTLNHTLLSVNQLESAGLIVAGIVIVCTTFFGTQYIEEDNRRTLKSYTKLPVFGPLPYMRGLTSSRITRQSFLRRCKPCVEELVLKIC